MAGNEDGGDWGGGWGGRVSVQLQWAPPSDRELRLLRAKARAHVRLCTRCILHERCRGPVPMSLPYTEDRRADFTVVGEAPGKQEDEKGRPFVGPAGKLMRAMITQAGLDQYEAAYVNVVSCWPKDSKGGAQTPGDEAQRACRGNLLEQVEAAGSPFVLLVGAVALNAFRDDLQVSRHHGQVYVWMGRWVVMPIIHPAAVLRASQLKRQVLEDLALWRQVVNGDIGMLDLIGEYGCCRCGRKAWEIDGDGVGYCEAHWEGMQGKMGKGERERQIKRWVTVAAKGKRRKKDDRTPGPGQISLLT